MRNMNNKHVAFAILGERVIMGYVHNYKFIYQDYSSVGSALVDLFNTEEIAFCEKHYISFAEIHSDEYTELIRQVREYNKDCAVELMELPSARIKFITPSMMSQNRVYHVLKKEMKKVPMPMSPEELATEAYNEHYHSNEPSTEWCCNCGAPGGECCMDCQYDTTMYPGASRGEKGWITRSINSRRKANNWFIQD